MDGTALTLTFSHDLDTGSKPANGAFTVTVAGSTRTLTSGGVAISGSTVTLTLSSAVTSGQTVTVSYDRPSSNPLQHAGQRAASFTTQTVTNITGDTTPPSPKFAVVTVTGTISYISIDFGEASTRRWRLPKTGRAGMRSP